MIFYSKNMNFYFSIFLISQILSTLHLYVTFIILDNIDMFKKMTCYVYYQKNDGGLKMSEKKNTACFINIQKHWQQHL